MHIGELAQSLEISTKTLRYYERMGLLPDALREENGYRQYSPDVVNLARKIVALRRLNLPIREIKDLLQNGSEDTLRKRLVSLLDQQRMALSLEIAVLQGKQEDLEARLLRLAQLPSSKYGHCICGLLKEPCGCSA